jgi:Trypsin-like peptidase domain
MKSVATSILLAAALTATSAAQNVKLKVRAALYDRDLNLKPVPHLTIKLVPGWAGAQAVTLQTSFEGSAEAELPGGSYHLSSESPVELFDKSYKWDFDVNLTKAENTIELSNDNAKATQLAAGREAHVDELASQYKRVKSAVVKVMTEQTIIDGFVIDSSGLVLTAQHPLDQATWLAVQLDDQRKLQAMVLAADKQRDMAVLRINPAGAGEIAVAQISPDPGALIEGERAFTVENTGKEKDRKLHIGVISRADTKEIVADAKLSRPGGPLFNSSGSAVGLVQYGDEKFRIVPLAQAKEILADAKQKLSSAQPSPRLLPTIPAEPFPADKLRAPGRGHWEKEFYSFNAGDFYVEFVTPIAQYEMDTENYEQEMKDYNKHSKGRTVPAEPEHNYEAVLRIAAVPQTRMPFWENFANSAASNRRAPTVLRYKNGFSKMRLLCGEKEVDPIWPRRVTEEGGRGWYTVLADESSGGRYVYTPEAISPQCGKVTLQLFSTKEPDRPIERVLDAKQVTRIWEDFDPYRALQKPAGGEPAK